MNLNAADADLTTSQRVTLVRAAIARVKDAEQYYRRMSGDTSAGMVDIGAARELLAARMREFSWQWINVEAVLDALAPEDTAWGCGL